MSCFSRTKSPEELAQDKKNKNIDIHIKDDRKNQTNKFKLLLLGTGDAGKSTFAKQMKCLHKEGFTKQELAKFTDILRENCLVGMRKLIQGCEEFNYDIPKKMKKAALAVQEATSLSSEIAECIQMLWTCDSIEKTFQRSNELQLPGGSSGVEYYVQSAVRFAQKDYLPSAEDVIRAKLRTTGIAETQFSFGGSDFVMVDVGGQRSERRKWLHCFVDVQAVIFLVAIDEYDMLLEEDNKTNRMEESLKLFSKLTGSQWFEETAFILFLNKTDLFEEKIRKKPLKDFFEDYEAFEAEGVSDSNEYEKSCAYVKHQYIEAFNGHRLYPFYTCAIDKSNCEKVFSAVRDTVIANALLGAGL